MPFTRYDQSPSPHSQREDDDDASPIFAGLVMRWVERIIMRDGPWEAWKEWRVVCDLFGTEDWWPPIVRAVNAIFDHAFGVANSRNGQDSGLKSISMNFIQSQNNAQHEIHNRFASGSSGQVFNSRVNGTFKENE